MIGRQSSVLVQPNDALNGQCTSSANILAVARTPMRINVSDGDPSARDSYSMWNPQVILFVAASLVTA